MADYAKKNPGFSDQEFKVPSNIEYRDLCEDTGELADSTCTKINSISC